jgi:hypothetical protein
VIRDEESLHTGLLEFVDTYFQVCHTDMIARV